MMYAYGLFHLSHLEQSWVMLYSLNISYLFPEISSLKLMVSLLFSSQFSEMLPSLSLKTFSTNYVLKKAISNLWENHPHLLKTWPLWIKSKYTHWIMTNEHLLSWIHNSWVGFDHLKHFPGFIELLGLCLLDLGQSYYVLKKTWH